MCQNYLGMSAGSGPQRSHAREDEMSTTSATNGVTVSRRHVLQLLGVGVVGAAAPLGCARSEEASDSGGVFRAAYPYFPPPKGNYNYLGGVTDQISMGYLFDLILLPGATYLWASGDYFYLLADESSELAPDGKTFTYVVREGLSWSDGKPITGQDVYTTWLLRWANNHAVMAYLDGFELTDKMTVTFHIKTPSPVTQYYLLRERPIADSVYSKWASQVEPLFTKGTPYDDPAVLKIVEDVNKFKPKEAVVSGPFHVDYGKVGNQQLTLVKNPRGYLVDKINFETITVANGETIVVTPLVLNKDIDYATHGFALSTEKQFIKNGYEVARPPTYGGPAIFINFAALPEFGDKRVRQALARAMDRGQTARITYGQSARTVELMAGISDRLVPKWMSTADQKRLVRYDFDQDKAASILTDAGWERRGTDWYLPDGSRAAYDLSFQSNYADNTAAAQNLASQFTAFGIKITLRGSESTQLAEDLKSGKFEFGMGGWGSSANPFPSAAYRSPLLDYNIPGLAADNQKGIDFDTKQETEVVGPIDFEQAIVDAGLGKNDEALKVNVGRLALAFNELLPVLPIYDRYGNNPVNTEAVTGWPSFDDPIYQNSPYADNFTTILMYQGKLKPA